MDLVHDLRKSGHNPKGVNNILTVLKSMFNSASREGLIKESPLRKLQPLKEEQKDFKIFNKEELRSFLEVNEDHELYPLFLMLLTTGCRKGEAAGLKVDALDFSKNEIVIKRTRDRYGLRETTKSKSIRRVPITGKLRAVLLEVCSEKQKSELVFRHKDGRPFSPEHLNRYWYKAQEKAGILNPIRVHDARHTFCSHFVMNGGQLFDLKTLVGHKSFKETLRYAHFSPDHLQNTLEFMPDF